MGLRMRTQYENACEGPCTRYKKDNHTLSCVLGLKILIQHENDCHTPELCPQSENTDTVQYEHDCSTLMAIRVQ